MSRCRAPACRAAALFSASATWRGDTERIADKKAAEQQELFGS